MARRDHSRYELIQKLKTKGYQGEEVLTIVAEMVANGYLDEIRFVENFIRAHRQKGHGPQRISAELQARGISAEMIAEHIQINDNAWLDEALRLWHKQFKGKRPKDFKERAKQMRFLQYRGFSYEQIMRVFEK